jgi:hypothetical protein
MAGGFSIGVAADTRAFESGVKAGIIAPVEDAQDALQVLARSGDKAGDGLSRGTREAELSLGKLGAAGKDAGDDIDRGARDAGQALDRLGRDGKSAGDDLEAGLKGAQKQTELTAADYRAMTAKIRAETEKIRQEGRDSFRGASEGTSEFKEEALSNFSEVTSSFQGDMTSITDLAQGTFGGLASLGGPASLVFGGLAVAVGLVGQAFATNSEESDEFKEKIQELAQTKLGDLFGQYEDSGNDLARGLREWAQDADSFGGSLTDLQKNTRKAGLEVGDYADAIATQSVPKMKEMRREVEAQIKSLDKQAGAQRAAGDGSSALANKLGEQSDAARAVKKQLDDNLEVNDQYEKSLRAVAKAQGLTVEQYLATADAQAAAEEASKSLEDSMKSLAEQSAESTAELVDNSSLGANNYIAGMEKRQAADDQYYANLQTVGKAVPDSVYQYLQGQGEAFSQELATYLSATPDQQARILEGWKKAAGSGTEIDGPTVKAKGDTSDVDKKTAEKGKEQKAGPTSKLRANADAVDKKTAEKGKEQKAGPTMKLRADDDAVEKAVARWRDKTYHATVKLKPDTSAVDAAIRRLDGRHISVIVDQQVGKKVT